MRASICDDGKPAAPPPNQIEDPDPRPGTNNWYKQSGYRSGSYTACADPSQPGVKAIRDYLASLPYKTFNDGNCAPGSYYLVNNYDRRVTPSTASRSSSARRQYVLPPQIAPKIGTRARGEGRVMEVVQRRTHGERHRQGSVLLDLRSADAFDRGHDRSAARESAGTRRALPRSRRRQDAARGLVRDPAQSGVRTPGVFDRVRAGAIREGRWSQESRRIPRSGARPRS